MFFKMPTDAFQDGREHGGLNLLPGNGMPVIHYRAVLLKGITEIPCTQKVSDVFP